MRKLNFLFCSTFIFSFIFSINPTLAQSKKIKLDKFSFTIPAGMKKFSPDSSTSQLAKLSLGNQLHITIGDNMEKLVNRPRKNPAPQAFDILDFSFKMKFLTIKSQYKGYNPTKKKTGKFKNFKYISQRFKCKATKTQEAYLEYRVLVIGGKHYEFIITGLEGYEKDHGVLMSNFWNSIVEN